MSILNNRNIAVFLDRDGTINEEANFVRKPEEFVLIPKAADAIAKLNRLGIKTFVLTNQSGIARGYYTEEILSLIHDRMKELLSDLGAFVDDIFFCPHHPEGSVPEYSIECQCRKPKPGLLLVAEKKYHIDLERSFVIGDMERDIETGKALNMKTILVLTGKGTETRERLTAGKTPDFIAEDLLDAVNYIEKTLNKK